jgi:hypothetical protein
MAENMCLMVTGDSDNINPLVRAVELAAAAVDLHKRTVLYLDKGWNQYAQLESFSALEKGKYTRELAANWRSFRNAGGQIWVSPPDLNPPIEKSLIKFNPQPLIEGIIIVDDKTLLTFLNQDTIVLTF